MANEQNLIPQNKRTKSEQREIARKGGIASGKSRKARKTFKEDLLLALSMIKDGKTVQEIGLESVVAKYLSGDLKAFEIVRDTVGEKPTDKQEVKIVETDWFVE